MYYYKYKDEKALIFSLPYERIKYSQNIMNGKIEGRRNPVPRGMCNLRDNIRISLMIPISNRRGTQKKKKNSKVLDYYSQIFNFPGKC